MAEKWWTQQHCPSCAKSKRESFILAQLWGSPTYRFTCERGDCDFVLVGQSDALDRSIGLKTQRGNGHSKETH